MAKFDPYAFCQKHPGKGAKTPIKDTVTGIKVTVPGLPSDFTPEGLSDYAEENGIAVKFPKRQIDATHEASPNGGKYEGEQAQAFMAGWLGVADAEEAAKPKTVPGNGRQTTMPVPAK